MKTLVALALLLLPGAAAAQGPPSFQTHHETIPNFAQSPTIRSVAGTAWSSPATWSLGRLPGPSDIVLISHAVTYDSTIGDADVIGIDAGGMLRFSTLTSTRLRVGTLLVMPNGALEVGTAAAPIPAHLTAEIVIKNRPLQTSIDPKQFGTGIVAIDGWITMHGAPKSPTFVRLTSAPRAGDSTLMAAQAVSGWQAGDRLVLPDSRQVPTESGTGDRNTATRLEVTAIASLFADARTLTVSPAFQHDHPGTTDENGDGAPDYLPHVANITRNVLVRSESRTGTRGHVLFHGRAAVDIRYVAFEGLGRTTFDDLNTTTNHIGRYALHLHHLMGPYPPVDPEYQFRLIGNSIYDDSPATPPQKWGITIHNTHYGLVRGNVVYNVGGAGLVTEDGSESYNVIEHNFVARVTSNGGRDEHFDSTRGIAREGVGFWFRGPNNYVRHNVAANMGERVADVEASYGFKYNMVFLGDVRVPNFRGADTAAAGQYTVRNGNSLPLLEFSGNEMYGLIQGLTLWWLCSVDFQAVASCPRSVLRDTVIWHASRYAYYGYPGNNYVFDGLHVYGDPGALGSAHEFKSIFFFGDYGTKDLLITNASFHNTVGLNPPYFRDGSIRVENSYFKTLNGIIHTKSGAPGSCPGCDLPDPDTILVNNRFAAVAGRPLRTISMSYTTHNGAGDPANNDRLFACGHNGQAGADFEVFYVSAGTAPCTTTRPDVSGGHVCATARAATACSSSAPPTPTTPSAPTNLRLSQP